MGHIRTEYAAFVTSALHTLIRFSREKLVGCMKGLTAVDFLLYSVSVYLVNTYGKNTGIMHFQLIIISNKVRK